MRLKLTAKNDKLIEKFISDPRYRIEIDGTIYNSKNRILGFTKMHETKRRGKAYTYIKYQGKELKVHRIIYAKFNGPLDRKLVVHHKDGNGLNNNASNLALITQDANMAETRNAA